MILLKKVKQAQLRKITNIMQITLTVKNKKIRNKVQIQN